MSILADVVLESVSKQWFPFFLLHLDLTDVLYVAYRVKIKFDVASTLQFFRYGHFVRLLYYN